MPGSLPRPWALSHSPRRGFGGTTVGDSGGTVCDMGASPRLVGAEQVRRAHFELLLRAAELRRELLVSVAHRRRRAGVARRFRGRGGGEVAAGDLAAGLGLGLDGKALHLWCERGSVCIIVGAYMGWR